MYTCIYIYIFSQMVAYIHEEDMLTIHCQKFDGGLALKGKGLVGIPRIGRKVTFVFCSFQLRLNTMGGCQV